MNRAFTSNHAVRRTFPPRSIVAIRFRVLGKDQAANEVETSPSVEPELVPAWRQNLYLAALVGVASLIFAARVWGVFL